MGKYLKVFSFYTIIYFIILSILIILTELTFGYWLDEYNFGPEMRGKRIQKIIINNNSKRISFFKDFYGFRIKDENINEQYDPSIVKVVFNGGSTSEEMFLNYDDTIVGNLNKFLKDDNKDIKIYNGAVSGKSLVGNVNEFSSWFKNIPNFNPAIMIYYIGLNDRYIRKKSERWHDYEIKKNFLENFYWNITQKSILWELLKKAKDKFFYTEVLADKYFTFSKEGLKELAKNKIIKYDEAKLLYKEEEITKNEMLIINNFKKNLYKLKEQLNEWDIKPIFITQITNDINGDKILFFLNNELKEFCKINDYFVIKLDEIIKEPLYDSFIDTAHTNEAGSKKIAKIIYPYISDFLKINLVSNN